jgi:hypothetical protein
MEGDMNTIEETLGLGSARVVLFIGVLVSCLGFSSARAEGVPQQIAALQQQVNTLTTTVSGLANQVNTLNTTVTQLTAVVNSQSALITQLQGQIAALQTQNQALACISPTSTPTDLYFVGCNVHVVNGAGATATANGFGNLMIGYNEVPGSRLRTGSHNLVVGPGHSYSSYGGLVAGEQNQIQAPFASITGGSNNRAEGVASSVSGGFSNGAAGQYSSVSGGAVNGAQGTAATISGGSFNRTFIGADYSSISGGSNNGATGQYSSVSGGFQRSAPGQYNWAAGSLLENQ